MMRDPYIFTKEQIAGLLGIDPAIFEKLLSSNGYRELAVVEEPNDNSTLLKMFREKTQEEKGVIVASLSSNFSGIGHNTFSLQICCVYQKEATQTHDEQPSGIFPIMKVRFRQYPEDPSRLMLDSLQDQKIYHKELPITDEGIERLASDFAHKREATPDNKFLPISMEEIEQHNLMHHILTYNTAPEAQQAFVTNCCQMIQTLKEATTIYFLKNFVNGCASPIGTSNAILNTAEATPAL